MYFFISLVSLVQAIKLGQPSTSLIKPDIAIIKPINTTLTYVLEGQTTNQDKSTLLEKPTKKTPSLLELDDYYNDAFGQSSESAFHRGLAKKPFSAVHKGGKPKSSPTSASKNSR